MLAIETARDRVATIQRELAAGEAEMQYQREEVEHAEQDAADSRTTASSYARRRVDDLNARLDHTYQRLAMLRPHLTAAERHPADLQENQEG